MFRILPRGIQGRCLRSFRNKNGALGIALRYVLVRNLAKSCGDNVLIQPGVFLFALERLELGDNVSIHPMCYVDGTGGLRIGNNVSIAHSSTVMTTNHSWDDLSIPIKYNRVVDAQVAIADDVWIGCGWRILAGVTIGKRSVVAAGAVVNRDVAPGTLVAGVPARPVKELPTKTIEN